MRIQKSDYLVKELFHTNSSSCHSILKGPPSQGGVDYIDGEFGWGWFFLSTPEEKELYMAVTLYQRYMNYLRKPDETRAGYRRRDAKAREFVNEVYGKPLLSTDPDYYYYVDHSSLLLLPYDKETDKIHLEFFLALSTYIVDSPDIQIGGGNDNDDCAGWRGETIEIVQQLERSDYMRAYPSNVYISRLGHTTWLLEYDKLVHEDNVSYENLKRAPEKLKVVIPLS